MNIGEYVIGIDTSNYTTSVAIISERGELIANLKQMLPVKAGERGLRQSDALFHHTVNLPELMKRVREITGGKAPLAIGVSDKPRNLAGSYMPCFLAGVSAAESMSAICSSPVYRFSHQCGHVMAALFSAGKRELKDSTFVAFHVSGGTTEMLRVSPDENGFFTEIVGGTRDLNAGQLVDRIGVALGLPFPAGAHLEPLAIANTAKIPKRKISRDGLYLNLSGVENIALNLYRDTADEKITAAFVFDYVARALDELSCEYESLYGNTKFVYAGGVMSNSIIKSYLSARHCAVFAEPALSADNAVGCAVLTLDKFKSENNR